MTCRYCLPALFVAIGLVRIVQAENAYSGHRLFYDASERSALEAISVNESASVVVPVVEASNTTTAYIRSTVQRSVSFDGIVIRHDNDGSSSAITWVDGTPDTPASWVEQSLKSYEHRVVRFGRSLSLKLGQTRLVSQEKAVESK